MEDERWSTMGKKKESEISVILLVRVFLWGQIVDIYGEFIKMNNLIY